jgi:hypothetical protein
MKTGNFISLSGHQLALAHALHWTNIKLSNKIQIGSQVFPLEIL